MKSCIQIPKLTHLVCLWGYARVLSQYFQGFFLVQKADSFMKAEELHRNSSGSKINCIGLKIMKKNYFYYLSEILFVLCLMLLSSKEYMWRPSFFLLKRPLALSLELYAFINWILSYTFVKGNIFLNGIWFSLTLQNSETNILTESSYI